ncbi:MAG: phosphatase PAP2 family protein [Rhodospirillaceae bacterium]
MRWVGALCRLRLKVAVLLLSLPISQAFAGESFTTYGDVGRYALPAGAAILALAKDDASGLTQLLASGAVTLGTTYALKYAIDDTRPNGGRRSFPSGHTAWAFSGAAFIYHRYGWEWGVPAEIAAAAVAVSRIDGNYHRWRDVIASAAIAHASAYFLVDRFDERVTLMPMIGAKEPAIGIAGRIRF